MAHKTIFLDRDGVINTEGGDYITQPEDLHLLPGAMEAIAALTKAGWALFIYTNQSGVGRGYMTLDALDNVHTYLRRQVEEAGGEICGVYACTHHPDEGCDCRKPKPGMLLQAAREHNVELTASYALGDNPRDVAAAKTAGCHAVLVLSGHTPIYEPETFPNPRPDYVTADLAAFARWLLGTTR